MEEDLSKWTQVLDRALDLPDVDWLIRSETAPDEALDIELTGGWVKFFFFISWAQLFTRAVGTLLPSYDT